MLARIQSTRFTVQYWLTYDEKGKRKDKKEKEVVWARKFESRAHDQSKGFTFLSNLKKKTNPLSRKDLYKKFCFSGAEKNGDRNVTAILPVFGLLQHYTVRI